MALSETNFRHGAWLLLQDRVSESTDLGVEVRMNPRTAFHEVIVSVRPKGANESIVFTEYTTESFIGFPSDELITKLMLIG